MCSATYTHAHSHTLTLTHTLSLSFSLSLSLTHTHTRSSQLACAIYPVPSNTCMLLHNSLVVDTFTIVVGGGEEEDEDHMKLPPISVVSSCMHNETELLARYLSPSPSSLSPVISCHSHPPCLVAVQAQRLRNYVGSTACVSDVEFLESPKYLVPLNICRRVASNFCSKLLFWGHHSFRSHGSVRRPSKTHNFAPRLSKTGTDGSFSCVPFLLVCPGFENVSQN